jgi:serine/threonine protein kinase
MATRHIKHFTIGNYVVSCGLGSNSFSRNQHAKHALSDLPVALKIIPKSNGNLSELQTEATQLSRLEHPHVARLFEFSSTEDYFYFAFGYHPSLPSLNEVIKTKGSFTEKSVWNLSRQIASALIYLNKEQIVVKNLNSNNVLLDQNQCIVTDIGQSSAYFLDTGYIAPERKNQNSLSCGAEAVIWSFGVLVYMMSIGSPPFNQMLSPESRFQSKICSGSDQDHFTEMAKLSQSCQILLIRCLEPDSSQRITIDELGCDQWLSRKGKHPLQVQNIYSKHPKTRLVQILYSRFVS